MLEFVGVCWRIFIVKKKNTNKPTTFFYLNYCLSVCWSVGLLVANFQPKIFFYFFYFVLKFGLNLANIWFKIWTNLVII